MKAAQFQTPIQEERVRKSIVLALEAKGGRVVEEGSGQLLVDVGGAGGSLGGFSDKMKVPLRFTLTFASEAGRTNITVKSDVHGGLATDLLAMRKRRDAKEEWQDIIQSAIYHADHLPKSA